MPWCTDHTFASVALVHVPHGEPYQGEADQGMSEDSWARDWPVVIWGVLYEMGELGFQTPTGKFLKFFKGPEQLSQLDHWRLVDMI